MTNESSGSGSTNTANSVGASSGKKAPSEMIGIYSVGKEIGKGSFAIVYKGYNSSNHSAVAIKSVNRSKLKSKKLIENLEIEISILKTMKHPHIVCLLDYKQTTAHFHLVMDYCSMGDLSFFIRRRNQLVKTHPIICSLLERYPSPEGSHGLNEVLVLHFLRQLSSALKFLRDKSLVHRDIKPQNLLLCPPAHSKDEFNSRSYEGMWELPILKIADFGFARFLPSTSMAETLCGSPLYMAPEILRYEKYNAKADLWSVGAVLYEMTVGKPPFKANNHIELLKNIEKANDRIKFPSAAQVPDSLKQLVRSLLKYNPTERISFQEFFNSDLVTCDLEDTNTPLERSEIDENLFISEYISPIKKSDRSRFLNPLPVLTSKQEEEEELGDDVQEQQQANSNARTVVEDKRDKEDDSKRQEATTTEEMASTSRDHPRHQRSAQQEEVIKNIINKSSPDPEKLSVSISNSPNLKIRKEDAYFEKDYVVVEKRAIEVNALADELEHAGSGAAAMNDPRYSLPGSAADKNKPQFSRPPRRTSSSGSGQRRPSFTDRKISISISPTNALSKAIGLASHRLFGVNPPPPTTASAPSAATGASYQNTQALGERSQNAVSFSEVTASPNFANHALLQKMHLPVSSKALAGTELTDQQSSEELNDFSVEDVVLFKLETIATKSHAVYLFADVKFSQLIPNPPSSADEFSGDFLNNTDNLPPRIVKTISEEGMVLYFKALSLLARGMAVASEWWYDQFGNQSLESKPQSSFKSSQKINQLVQWIREKFNECLEKAEFVKLRLQEAKLAIAELDGGALEADDGVDTPKVVAEKLIFDRALEMSRNAAVNELVKEDLKGCELAYSTAIWMLEALLDENEPDGGVSDCKLDDDDKLMVEKFIVSIGNRLSVLKKKLDVI
ncbi:uncharacterized protein LODBEIA_P52530 [Lodderomyces beijingensis]|uniref:Serine/threonine-protein kinase ATG1 n=1 Tax=Lodderomyces beijingensis TaxID=1775926 RepID=A0ABP0ZT11_9ASCO